MRKALAKAALRGWQNTDQITKWIQVVAIMIAGYWTYNRFLHGEAPSLETRVSVTTSLEWQWQPYGSTRVCEVTFEAHVENQGLTSFDVGGVHIQAWRSEILKTASDVPQFVEVEQLEQGKKLVDLRPPARILRRHFTPQHKAAQTLTWIVDNKRDPAGMYLFRADVEDSRGAELGFSRYWTSHLCLPESPSKESPQGGSKPTGK